MLPVTAPKKDPEKPPKLHLETDPIAFDLTTFSIYRLRALQAVKANTGLVLNAPALDTDPSILVHKAQGIKLCANKLIEFLSIDTSASTETKQALNSGANVLTNCHFAMRLHRSGVF